MIASLPVNVYTYTHVYSVSCDTEKGGVGLRTQSCIARRWACVIAGRLNPQMLFYIFQIQTYTQRRIFLCQDQPQYVGNVFMCQSCKHIGAYIDLYICWASQHERHCLFPCSIFFLSLADMGNRTAMYQIKAQRGYVHTSGETSHTQRFTHGHSHRGLYRPIKQTTIIYKPFFLQTEKNMIFFLFSCYIQNRLRK